MIETIGLKKVFKSGTIQTVALTGINLKVEKGEFMAVMGPSGCGKSTLLNMITGIDHPTAGEVIIGNENIYKMSESKRALWRGRNMGVVFQFFQLLPTLTLLENTMLPMDYCNLYPFYERPDRAMELLKVVGLEDQAHKLPMAVSSGQQQGAAIARSLATNPSIILADEPTGNLDSRTAESVFQLLNSLVAQGKTVIMVTHDSSLAKRTSRSMIISDGELVNEWVTRAFPLFSHRRLLWLTHHLQERSLAPGTPLVKDAGALSSFYLITAGQAEVVLNHGRRRDENTPRLLPGDAISQMDLQVAGGDICGFERARPETPAARALKDKAFETSQQRAPGEPPAMQDVGVQRVKARSAANTPCLRER